jgi:3-hydroxyisobutyrate dehydrogenase/2-hydroxy-3-oxopropionate reductase
MGAAMAQTLHRAGINLILWNRGRATAERHAADLGASVATSPADAARSADIVLSSLADDTALRDVYLGADGVVEGMGQGKIAMDTSTVDPETVIEVGAAVDVTGGSFLDCPVSGSVSTVEAGTLTIMVGGDPSLIGHVAPVLDALAAKVVHAGDRGSGAATKLAVNGLVHGLNIALSEALVLAEKAGVARSTAYDVFASGAGGAPFVTYKRQAFEHPETTPVAFSLDLVAKDLELITGLARRVGAPMAQAQTGLNVVNDAIEAGMGDRDLSAVAVYLRNEEGS